MITQRTVMSLLATTAVVPDAAAELARFADDYPAYLGSWRRAILDHVVSGGRMPEPV